MPTLQITEPIGSFEVTIKDSSGSTVYGPTTHDNTAFDPGLVTPDDYIVYVDNDGAVNGFCFTISDCECPVFIDAAVTYEDPTFYGALTFDMSGGFGCPFEIYVETAFTSGTFAINSLSDFTSNDGTDYTKSFVIGGAGALYYQVRLLDGTICIDGHALYECTPPIFCTLASGNKGYIIITNVDCTEFALVISVFNCGTSCNTYTVNYLQINSLLSGDPDSGSFSATADCTNYPLCTLNQRVLAPNLDFVGFDGCDGEPLRYSVTIIDCCGNTYSGIYESP